MIRPCCAIVDVTLSGSYRLGSTNDTYVFPLHRGFCGACLFAMGLYAIRHA
jgi:hypothetical protein